MTDTQRLTGTQRISKRELRTNPSHLLTNCSKCAEYWGPLVKLLDESEVYGVVLFCPQCDITMKEVGN